MDEIISEFVRKHLNLLKLERDENLQKIFNNISSLALRNLEKEGEAITKLSVGSLASRGLKQLQIDFVNANNQPLKHAFVVGDLVVCIQAKNRNQLIRGLVSAVAERVLSVTLTDQTENVDEEEQFAVVKADSDYTYECQTRALKNLESTDIYYWRCFNIIRLLFDDDESVVQTFLESDIELPDKHLRKDGGGIDFINSKLAEDQKAAVDFALRKKYLAIIQGPPGTGKTTTLVELIGQLCRFGKKVLVCAPTNVAVDNVASKLCDVGLKPLRMGHPARISKSVQNCSLDANVQQDNGYEVLIDIKKTLKELRDKNENDGGPVPWKNIKELNKEYRDRMDKITLDIIRKHPVILCTLNSATNGKMGKVLRHVPKDYFDVLVIDEASQATEASTWIAIPNAEKLVLAGDINQLPPAVMNQKAAKSGLSLSLMERAIKKLGKKSYRSLEIQYRMNKSIMSWSSEKFYDNTLKADKMVENHLLIDLHGVKESSLTTDSLIFIDTCGCDCEEYEIGSGIISKGNVGEAIVVDRIVTSLINSGVSEKDIGVITPYALQVDFIRKSLSARSISVEISTVDGFQGREKEVIVLSLVRSNEEKSLGFLTDYRRLNVAVTRARRLLAVIVNSETVGDNELISGLLKHIEDNGVLQTAQEYLEENLEDLKKELESNVRVKKKLESSENSANQKSALEKRKKLFQKTKDENKKEDDNLKSVFKNKGIGLSANDNRKNYNPFEGISENDDDEESVFESVIEEREEIEKLNDEVKEIEEIEKPQDEVKKEEEEEEEEEEESLANQKSESKTNVIGLSDLISSLKNLGSKNPLEGPSRVLVESKPNREEDNKKGKKNSEKMREKKSETNNEKEDDFDKLIASVTANDFICAMAGCKKSTQLMHVNCEFCKSRFCLKHGMQEIHGCGEAVRRKEKRDFVKRKPEKTKPVDKNKFAMKLKELEEARKPKKRNDKKSK